MDDLNYINNDIKFTKRATPIPLGTRMSYRIAQICLIMSLCCKPKESCSMQKIQIISNAMFQPQEFQNLIQYTKNGSLILNFIPRIDPCVNSAIEFIVKYGMCTQATTNRKYKLTALGRRYVAAIYQNEVMEKEKTMLMELGVNLTENILKNIGN